MDTNVRTAYVVCYILYDRSETGGDTPGILSVSSLRYARACARLYAPWNKQVATGTHLPRSVLRCCDGISIAPLLLSSNVSLLCVIHSVIYIYIDIIYRRFQNYVNVIIISHYHIICVSLSYVIVDLNFEKSCIWYITVSVYNFVFKSFHSSNWIGVPALFSFIGKHDWPNFSRKFLGFFIMILWIIPKSSVPDMENELSSFFLQCCHY